MLHYGEVLTEGTFDEVKADPRVYEVYLGSGVMPGLDVDGIHTYYGESHVLHGVSLARRRRARRWRSSAATARARPR